MQSVLILSVLALAASIASAYDPSPLQDFCVATNNSNNALFVNGRFCKDPKLATPEDFFTSGLNRPANTNNRLGFGVSAVADVDTVPGLNTLGLQLASGDLAPNGVGPIHFHPRSSEILVVSKGKVMAGFVTSNQADGSNKLFSKVLNEGDVFVIPLGLVHFVINMGRSTATLLAVFNSQNPGFVDIAETVFGSTPPISPDYLARAFRLDKNTVERLQREF